MFNVQKIIGLSTGLCNLIPPNIQNWNPHQKIKIKCAESLNGDDYNLVTSENHLFSSLVDALNYYGCW